MKALLLLACVFVLMACGTSSSDGGGPSGTAHGWSDKSSPGDPFSYDPREQFSGPNIDKEAIRQVVLANLIQIKECYLAALQANPGLAGKIVIEWTIRGEGIVSEAHVKSDTMNSPELEKCSTDKILTWKFPNPPTGETAIVRYPFVFQSE